MFLIKTLVMQNYQEFTYLVLIALGIFLHQLIINFSFFLFKTVK